MTALRRQKNIIPVMAGAGVLVLAIGTLAFFPRTGEAQSLPGNTLSALTCMQIMGGTGPCQKCVYEDPMTACNPSFKDKGCEPKDPPNDWTCLEEGDGCGDASCSGPNHKHCVGDVSMRYCQDGLGQCCQLTWEKTCKTTGQLCSCDGPPKDEWQYSRRQCVDTPW